jgi:hypothetical protein
MLSSKPMRTKLSVVSSKAIGSPLGTPKRENYSIKNLQIVFENRKRGEKRAVSPRPKSYEFMPGRPSLPSY